MITRILYRMRRGPWLVQSFFLTGAAVLLVICFHQSPDIRAEEEKTAAGPAQPATTSVPDREVQYKGNLSPDWKVNWDRARELYREQKYREALVQYELLLSQKPSCDEARWEYVTLLIRRDRWQQAGEQLEKLLAKDPDNIDYRFAMAEMSVKTGQTGPAVALYKKLYDTAAEKPAAVRALAGLIEALEMRREPEPVIFYLEKLIDLTPDNLQLRIKLAGLALESDQFDKARALLADLEGSMPEDLAILHLQAGLQQKLGNRDSEAGYRQQIIGIDPDDVEAHTMLLQYYREKENWAMSLRHLDVLLKKTPHDIARLEAAAELNIRLDRIDRALEYYDYILALQPGNRSVFRKKKEAQKILAEDLVVLVEHDGGQKLWQDLVNVTSDRTGVYREIASLLAEKGNTKELIEVMTLLCLEDPTDEITFAELKTLLKKNGRVMELEDLLEKQQKRIQ